MVSVLDPVDPHGSRKPLRPAAPVCVRLWEGAAAAPQCGWAFGSSGGGACHRAHHPGRPAADDGTSMLAQEGPDMPGRGAGQCPTL
jgi:hypothetical protein